MMRFLFLLVGALLFAAVVTTAVVSAAAGTLVVLIDWAKGLRRRA